MASALDNTPAENLIRARLVRCCRLSGISDQGALALVDSITKHLLLDDGMTTALLDFVGESSNKELQHWLMKQRAMQRSAEQLVRKLSKMQEKLPPEVNDLVIELGRIVQDNSLWQGME